jgi:hypothetical protein
VYLRNGFSTGYEPKDTVVIESRTPRRFERDSFEGDAGLYYDRETATTLTTAAQINALTDMISIGNTD